jgi:hypothetical protein
MELSQDYFKAIKISLLLIVISTLFSVFLAYNEWSNYDIEDPSNNSWWIVIKNTFDSMVLWGLIGFLVKDYKSAIITIGVAFLTHLFIFYFLVRSWDLENNNLFILISMFSAIPQYLTFGFLHYKSAKGFHLLLLWLTNIGLGVLLYSPNFMDLLENFSKIFDLDSPWLIRIPKGDGHSHFNIFSIFTYEVFLIIQISVFWWFNGYIKSKKSINDSLKTCYNPQLLDRFTYSIIYWVFRFILFLAAFNILVRMNTMIGSTSYILLTFKILASSIGLIIVTSIYRNFLISFLTLRNRYPEAFFFLLNIPFINILIWIYSLIFFKNRPGKGRETSDFKERFEILKAKFIQEGKNSYWKKLLMLTSLLSVIYQLYQIGFSITDIDNDGILVVLVITTTIFGLLLWFFLDKNALYPILILNMLGILIIGIFELKTFYPITLGAGFINLVLFFAMFHYDDLKWETESEIIMPAQNQLEK